MDGQQTNSYENLERTTCDTTGEVWKDIPGYEGIYQVSNMGHVKSLTRRVWNYTKPGRILKLYHKNNGYLTVNLCGKNQSENTHMSIGWLLLHLYQTSMVIQK